MGCALPMAPAGIVIVTCVPVAGTLLTTAVPRLAEVSLGGVGRAGGVPDAVRGGGSVSCIAIIVEELSIYRYPATGSKIVCSV